MPSDWHVNSAAVAGDQTPTWTIVYATHEASGFLRVAQGFDADTAWDARLLRGAAPQEELPTTVPAPLGDQS